MNERSLFLRALETDDPAERAAFLRGACGDDEALRRRVEELLRSHESAGSFLIEPALEQGVTAPRSGNDEVEAILGLLDPATDKPGVIGRLKHYEVVCVIGQGSMGVVLKAFDPTLNRYVALKVMVTQLATNGGARRRFEREARAAAAISHEHIIAIYEVGEFKSIPYLVMEYVAGGSLRERLERRGLPDVKETLRIGAQIATGLAAAHKVGLVHRDIKPDNILLQNGVERVKITDFGLARAVDDVSLTRSGVIAGTPQYMSPEQSRGEPIDHRVDLFSLGSVLYAMCAGHPPFKGDSVPAVLKRINDDEPRPLRLIDPEVPEWLSAIISKLLAKRPEDRFQTAAEVADLLGQHLAHLQQPNRVPMPALVVARGPRSKTGLPAWVYLLLLIPLLPLCCSPLPVVFFWLMPISIPVDHPPDPEPLPESWADQTPDIASMAYIEIRGNDPDVHVHIQRIRNEETVKRERLGVKLEYHLPAETYRIAVERNGIILVEETYLFSPGSDSIVTISSAKDADTATLEVVGYSPDETVSPGFTPLFSGKNLQHWLMDPHANEVWSLKHFMLHGRGGPSYVYSARDYKDFHLRAIVKINDSGDSGILIRAPGNELAAGNPFPGGYEAQINSTNPDKLRTGSLYLKQHEFVGTNPRILPDTWFTLEIIASEYHLTVKVNGIVTLDIDDPKATYRKGRIALQSSGPGTVITFRKIEIMELPDPIPDAGPTEPRR